jgi:hypothetical protein
MRVFLSAIYVSKDMPYGAWAGKNKHDLVLTCLTFLLCISKNDDAVCQKGEADLITTA